MQRNGIDVAISYSLLKICSDIQELKGGHQNDGHGMRSWLPEECDVSERAVTTTRKTHKKNMNLISITSREEQLRHKPFHNRSGVWIDQY